MLTGSFLYNFRENAPSLFYPTKKVHSLRYEISGIYRWKYTQVLATVISVSRMELKKAGTQTLPFLL